MRLSLVVLAARLGSRMSYDLPKVLHALAGATLLARALRAGPALGPERLVVVTGRGAEAVAAAARKWEPEAPSAHQAEQLCTGHAVAQARYLLTDFVGDISNLCRRTLLMKPKSLDTIQEVDAREETLCSAILLHLITMHESSAYKKTCRIPARSWSNEEAWMHWVASANPGAKVVALADVQPALKKGQILQVPMTVLAATSQLASNALKRSMNAPLRKPDQNKLDSTSAQTSATNANEQKKFGSMWLSATAKRKLQIRHCSQVLEHRPFIGFPECFFLMAALDEYFFGWEQLPHNGNLGASVGG